MSDTRREGSGQGRQQPGDQYRRTQPHQELQRRNAVRCQGIRGGPSSAPRPDTRAEKFNHPPHAERMQERTRPHPKENGGTPYQHSNQPVGQSLTFARGRREHRSNFGGRKVAWQNRESCAEETTCCYNKRSIITNSDAFPFPVISHQEQQLVTTHHKPNPSPSKSITI